MHACAFLLVCGFVYWNLVCKIFFRFLNGS